VNIRVNPKIVTLKNNINSAFSVGTLNDLAPDEKRVPNTNGCFPLREKEIERIVSSRNIFRSIAKNFDP